ncbi:MAG: hypothetical protein AB2375_06690 [Tissierellaceae bacterium]|jgi:hypothetical protein
MIVHIGENISLFGEDIVAVLDINTVLKCEDTKNFIDELMKKDCLANDLEKNVKTYIIATDHNSTINRKKIGKYKLYVSSISSTSLLKRMNTDELDWGKVND